MATQPVYRISPQYTLASIIQGEAGGEGRTGMMAVASVIQNRAEANFSGFGTSLVDQALAHNQFQSQVTPRATALDVANQLYSGNLRDITGGATSYANPSSSTPGNWGSRLNTDNALQIGHHFFTDNQKGIPFTGNTDFANAAAQNGTAITGGGFGTDPTITAPDAAGFNNGLAGPNSPDSGQGIPAPDAASTVDGLAGPMANNSGNNGPASYPLDPGIAAQAGIAPSDTSYIAQKQDMHTIDQSFSKGQTKQSPKSPDIPSAIDNQTKGAAADISALDNAIQGLAKTVQDSTKLSAQTGKDLADKSSATSKNLFTRGTMILTGIVFLAGGLWLFAHPEEWSGIKSSLQPA